MRIDTPLGLIPPLQGQRDLAQVTFERALEIVPQIPDFLNQMVDIEASNSLAPSVAQVSRHQR